MSKAPKDTPLQAKIEGPQLVIRVGIDTLAFAAERCPKFYNYEKHKGSLGPYMKVTAKRRFARDMIAALLREDEAGTTMLCELFDEAVMLAFEDGAEITPL